jgi:ATP adenylyltransferase
VLLVTKDFEEQLEPLNDQDFKCALLTCRALDGMLFFNCGFNSGASIKHKHMQIIPYRSFQGGILPIEEAAKSYRANATGEAVFELPAFGPIKHKFVDLKLLFEDSGADEEE